MASVYPFFRMRGVNAGCKPVNPQEGIPTIHRTFVFGVKMIWMGWKYTPAIVNLAAAILFLCIYFLCIYARRCGRARSAIDRGDGSVEFPPDLLTLLALLIFGLLPAWDSSNRFSRHHAGDLFGEFTLATMLFVVGVELFRFPGTVKVVPGGIEQHFWLRGEKRIRWGEITEIKDGVFGGSLTITGTDGTKIIYSDKLADRPRFLEELERNAHGRLPRKTTAGTLLNLQGRRKSG
jgi:hypothetical protein